MHLSTGASRFLIGLRTEAEYRALAQKFVDRARWEQFIADRLAEEARRRFGTDIDAPTETE